MTRRAWMRFNVPPSLRAALANQVVLALTAGIVTFDRSAVGQNRTRKYTKLGWDQRTHPSSTISPRSSMMGGSGKEKKTATPTRPLGIELIKKTRGPHPEGRSGSGGNSQIRFTAWPKLPPGRKLRAALYFEQIAVPLRILIH